MPQRLHHLLDFYGINLVGAVFVKLTEQLIYLLIDLTLILLSQVEQPFRPRGLCPFHVQAELVY